MGKFIAELLTGFKWVLIAILLLSVLIAGWLGCAWGIGWAINHFFDLRNFGPKSYLAYGSCIIAITFILQVITILLTGWVLIAYGKSSGFIGKIPNLTK